jgi:hypothetical protein
MGTNKLPKVSRDDKEEATSLFLTLIIPLELGTSSF